MLINTPRKGLFFVIFSVLSLCTSTSANGQQATQTPSLFANINGGFGMSYGGLGGNLEAGVKHFSGFGAVGYAPQGADGTIIIKPSINYHFGVRYYFDVGNDQFFPRLGVGCGWITNYYDTRIGVKSYVQNVQGFAIQPGAQFYSAEGFVFSFDLAISGAPFIFNPNTHPYFYKAYVRPCIGIGYDLTRILQIKRKTKKIKNDEINPFGLIR